MSQIVTKNAKTKIKQGIDKVTDIVKVTLGPLGRHQILDTNPYGYPIITNDGVTIIRQIKDDKNPLSNTGIKIVREASEKTNDSAGDGTTTAAILVQSLVQAGLEQIASGRSPVLVRQEIDSNVAEVITSIKSEVIKTDDLKALEDIATISSRDKALGNVVADTVKKVGLGGLVTLEVGTKPGISADIREGLELRGGLVSPFFITHKALQQAIHEDCLIVVTDQSLTSGVDLFALKRIWEEAVKAGKNQCVIIANDIGGVVLDAMIRNDLGKIFYTLPLKVVGYGDMGEGSLRDICAATGATFITPKDGRKLADFTEPEFGRATKLIAKKDTITIYGGQGDIESRLEELKAQLKDSQGYEKESLQERIAKLKSSFGTITVGGLTDTEKEDQRLRAEDAINATRAAMSEGVIAGGGSALYRAAQKTESHLVKQACEAPLRQLAENSNVTLDRSDLKTILDPNMTIDFRTGQVVEAHKSGIIDPVKVVISALENAATQAGLFLTSEGAVVETVDTSEKV